MRQHRLPLDDTELEAALIREAAAFRCRDAGGDDAAGARPYRSERAERVARAHLDALHDLFATSKKGPR